MTKKHCFPISFFIKSIQIKINEKKKKEKLCGLKKKINILFLFEFLKKKHKNLFVLWVLCLCSDLLLIMKDQHNTNQNRIKKISKDLRKLNINILLMAVQVVVSLKIVLLHHIPQFPLLSLLASSRVSFFFDFF